MQLEEKAFCYNTTLIISDRLSMCVQGDKEKALAMAVSPLMDRATQGGMTRSQVSHAIA